MATLESTQWLLANPIPALILILILIPLAVLTRSIYRLTTHPLAPFPGPKLASLTTLWLAYHTYIGTESTAISTLHKKHGPIVRIGPNDIDIDDGDAIEPIYVSRGGFPKTPAYAKFDIDGHRTVFSTLTLGERRGRAGCVKGLFSGVAVGGSRGVLEGVVDCFVEGVRREVRVSSGSGDCVVDVLNAGRCMAIDAVSSHLFGRRFGATTTSPRTGDEGLGVMAASPFVDSCVGVGAFFNLALGRFGEFLLSLALGLWESKESRLASDLIDRFTGELVRSATPRSDGSYQSRLLQKVSARQAQVELKDVCFAGTDSTGMNIAMILWYLAKYPDIYTRLHQEIHDFLANSKDPIQSPYLRGVIREGLRLSQANPTRLPRLVPQGGWQYKDHYIPAGTSVGVSAFQMHRDENVFPDPLRFMPDRWEHATDAMVTHFFAFGKGARACIAQRLAVFELSLAVVKVVQADLLRGATVTQDSVEILEWFNSRVKGGGVFIRFDPRVAA